MNRSLRAVALLCTTLLSACGGSSVSAVPLPRTPDPSLLLPCRDPELTPDPGTDNDYATDELTLASAYAQCKARHAALVEFERSGK